MGVLEELLEKVDQLKFKEDRFGQTILFYEDVIDLIKEMMSDD